MFDDEKFQKNLKKVGLMSNNYGRELDEEEKWSRACTNQIILLQVMKFLCVTRNKEANMSTK